MEGGVKLVVFRQIEPISLYFESGTRYGHSYNGRRIGTRMLLIEQCHFE